MNTWFSRLRDWVNGEPAQAADRPAPQKRQPRRPADQSRRPSRQPVKNVHPAIFALCGAFITAVLLAVVVHLPAYGDPEAPTVNEVVDRYLNDGLEETGALNLIAGMILDYRAFDTFGESAVLFLAIASVSLLLGAAPQEGEIPGAPPRDDGRSPILRLVARLLCPIALLFGAYVVMNGHLSPGGGFSGGAIMGGGLILLSNAFGSAFVSRFFTIRLFRLVSAGALLVYAGSKSYSFFTGANHLPSIISTGTPGALFSAGLIPILNICVGLVVACTMYGFYSLFTRGKI